MKTITTHIYSYAELSDEAKKTAVARLAEEAANNDCILEHVYSEIQDSLEAICEGFNLKLVDYSYGVYCRSYNVTVENYDIENLRGNEAKRLLVTTCARYGYPQKVVGDNEYPFDGICGFSGVCYDDTILAAIWEGLCDGLTIKQAFNGVAHELCKLCAAEYQYLTSEEYALESLNEKEEQFTHDGELA